MEKADAGRVAVNVTDQPSSEWRMAMIKAQLIAGMNVFGSVPRPGQSCKWAALPSSRGSGVDSFDQPVSVVAAGAVRSPGAQAVLSGGAGSASPRRAPCCRMGVEAGASESARSERSAYSLPPSSREVMEFRSSAKRLSAASRLNSSPSWSRRGDPAVDTAPPPSTSRSTSRSTVTFGAVGSRGGASVIFVAGWSGATLVGDAGPG